MCAERPCRLSAGRRSLCISCKHLCPLTLHQVKYRIKLYSMHAALYQASTTPLPAPATVNISKDRGSIRLSVIDWLAEIERIAAKQVKKQSWMRGAERTESQSRRLGKRKLGSRGREGAVEPAGAEARFVYTGT